MNEFLLETEKRIRRLSRETASINTNWTLEKKYKCFMCKVKCGNIRKCCVCYCIVCCDCLYNHYYCSDVCFEKNSDDESNEYKDVFPAKLRRRNITNKPILVVATDSLK